MQCYLGVIAQTAGRVVLSIYFSLYLPWYKYINLVKFWRLLIKSNLYAERNLLFLINLLGIWQFILP